MSEPVESSAPASLRTVGRNTGILFGSQSITWVVSAVLLAFIPRFIGPTRLGQFAVASSLWAMVAVIVRLGTSTFVTLESARDHDQAGRFIGPVIRARFLASFAGWILIVGFAIAVGYSGAIVLLAALMGIVLTIEVFTETERSALVGLERMADVARVSITTRVVGAAAVLAALFVTRDIYAVVVVGIIPALMSSFMLHRRLSRLTTVQFSASWSEVKLVVKGGAPFLIAGVALIVYQQVDVIVMSLLVDEHAIGWYGAADRLFGTLLFAPSILTVSLLPALTREHAREPTAAAHMVARAFDALVILAVPIGLTAVVSADQFTLLLFGDEFAEAGPVFAVFGVVVMLTFFSILFGSYAVAIGRQTAWNVLIIAAIAASILLDLVLVPWTDSEFDNGAIGGALAFVFTEGAMVLYGVWKLAPQIVTARRIALVVKCAVAGGCLIGAAWFIRDRFFVLPALAGMAAYVVALVALRVLDRDEVARLRHLVPSRRASAAHD
jgi:O-antigen/teichoic acid export membrane protein